MFSSGLPFPQLRRGCCVVKCGNGLAVGPLPDVAKAVQHRTTDDLTT
jgi:hypothetical protein